MSYRSRRERKAYSRHIKKVQPTGICEFCGINEGHPDFITGTGSIKVIRNTFPYSYFDYHKVDDHLMVVPVKHTDTLSSLSPQEASEYIKLISSYEAKGYDIFARAPTSKQKTVLHQHTHLIKPVGKEIKTFIYSKKPFVRITL